MSEMLEKARNYETEKQVYVKKTTKPLFHVTAPTGWINDPNGFSVYDGKIHLFYQYNPYQREWGPMHWGHSVTDDMVRWEQHDVSFTTSGQMESMYLYIPELPE